ncbi:CDP-glycerol glycerophosphotransferase family protein [Providencia sp. PROV200]|uniref:CDP-glycerol glycerophosphotransferase family protein n=1 Tax=Providencia sp. PROV200 TaxID=2936794 RepID=UPI003CEDB6B9
MKIIFIILFDFIFSLIFFLSKLDKNLVIFNSTKNTNFNFNSKFLFESMLSHKDFKNKKIYFVTNDRPKRDELNKIYPNHFISSNSLSGRILCLKAKIWITSTIETPVWGIAKNPYRIVYHLGHGIPLKNIGLAEENLSMLRWVNRKLRLRLFTHVTAYSNLFDDFFKKVFDSNNIKLLHFGQPRNDSLLSGKRLDSIIKLQPKSIAKYVLYSPTWRPYADTKLFPFEEFSIQDFHQFLEDNNIIFFIRDHPFYESQIPIGLFNSSYVVDARFNIITDITSFLDDFDILITDYSSIYLDFLILKKKVIYLPYDFEKHKKEVGFSNPYNTLIYGPIIKSYSELLYELSDTKTSNDDELISFLSKLNLKPKLNCHEHLNYISGLLK